MENIYKNNLDELNEKLLDLKQDTITYASPYSHKESDSRKEGFYHPVRTELKIQRNEPCPCGSGKKYKKCCINKF